MLQKVLTFQSVRTSYIIILMIQTKLFSDLYLAKFLDISVKPFFPCNKCIKITTSKGKNTILARIHFHTLIYYRFYD